MDAAGQSTDAAYRTRAHVVPFAVFMAFLVLHSLLAPLIEWNHPAAPWWKQDCRQWIYPLQTFVCLALLIHYRRAYHFQWSTKWSLAAIVVGALGIAIWLAPSLVHDHWTANGQAIPSWLEWLGVQERRNGFNPEIFSHPMAYGTAVILRFLRAVIVVAFIEELFWRGFLMRFLLNPNGDYWKQPFGKGSWLSYAVVTGLFVMIHAAPDRPAAFLYGSLTYGFCMKSRSLGACVIMHAVANLLMGVFIMATGKYGLW